MRERVSIFRNALRSVPHTICYSVKANSNLSILRLLARFGAGFDIVSGGELERVRLARKQAVRKIVFSGVGKTEAELQLALRSGILLFNVESEGELELLARSAARLRKTSPLGCVSISLECRWAKRQRFTAAPLARNICASLA